MYLVGLHIGYGTLEAKCNLWIGEMRLTFVIAEVYYRLIGTRCLHVLRNFVLDHTASRTGERGLYHYLKSHVTGVAHTERMGCHLRANFQN